MPLKIITRPGSSFFYVRGTIRGQSIFESTGATERRKAEEYRAHRESELWNASLYGQKAVITFAAAVESYLNHAQRSHNTQSAVEKLVQHFGTTPLHQIDQVAVDRAYAKILRDGHKASPATKLRQVLTPLRAILEHAAIRKWCDRPAFDVPRVTKAITPYLKPDEADALIAAASSHLKPLIVFLICTGARLSEALEIEWQSVDLVGRRATLWQKQGTERDVDLPNRAISALSALSHRSARIFRPPATRKRPNPEGYLDTGRTSGGQIKKAWATACREAGLSGHWHEWVSEKGAAKKAWVSDITPHHLRHTWATWQYCLHGDLLALQRDGGWSNITMVTRYAKKMPDAYREAVDNWLRAT
ncbi:site-specific integrase [Gluconacetobacter azotocaptans]|uniref:site-specific integrase n=1 Tax=Gluconacetobacter azotocaptans TaxID=142834 RepID=UPI00195D63DA|nr:site-specific integrase [Gluconacetobacter azotocaptans]MBM9401603.1 site-specific integrase [Gluconacetobacter azotocaptans]